MTNDKPERPPTAYEKFAKWARTSASGTPVVPAKAAQPDVKPVKRSSSKS